MKELSLRELAKSNAWIMQRSESRIRSFDINSILYKVSPKKYKSGDSKILVTLRIGIGAAKKIKISPGDRINIFYHPDDLLSCMLVKSTSPTGYRINFEAKSKDKLRLAFMWKRPVMINETGIIQAEYIHIAEKNMILFRIEQ